MNRQIICTVGTSLLTNRDGRPWAGWNSKEQSPPPSEADIAAWMATVELERASAESNTLRALKLGDTDELTLLHSDTPEGRLCAKALAIFYQRRCRAVSLEQIGRLGYGADEFTSGLKSLVDIALRVARDARKKGNEPVFCATGGFKAQIAFLNLLGALLGIEVDYIHELHSELVRLPRLPLTWNADIVSRYDKFFTWIDQEPRSSGEVRTWLSRHPELESLVEADGQGHTLLTAAGDLLYKAAKEQLALGPRAIWPPEHPVPPERKNQVSSVEHHRPAGWKQFVDQLCTIDCVKTVRYDVAAHGSPRVKILDTNLGVFGVCFGATDSELPLRVETTAKGASQCELVAGYLRQLK